MEHIDIPLRWRGKTKCLPATDMKDLYRTGFLSRSLFSRLIVIHSLDLRWSAGKLTLFLDWYRGQVCNGLNNEMQSIFGELSMEMVGSAHPTNALVIFLI